MQRAGQAVTAILFLWHHWLVISVLISVVAFCALEPALALIFAKNHLPVIVAVTLGVMASLYFEHRGEVWQERVDAKQIASLRTELATNRHHLDMDAAVLSQIAANADANRSAATAQAEQSKKELARVRANAKAHDRTLQAALDQYRKARPVSCATEVLPDGVLE